MSNKVFGGIALVTHPVFFLAPGKAEVAGRRSMSKNALDEGRGRGNTGESGIEYEVIPFPDGIINGKRNGSQGSLG